jgi:hypothetical protein
MSVIVRMRYHTSGDTRPIRSALSPRCRPAATLKPLLLRRILERGER